MPGGTLPTKVFWALLATSVVAVGTVAFIVGAFVVNSRETAVNSRETAVHVPGAVTPFLTVTSAHGNVLKEFGAYYQDGYIHVDLIPSTNGPLTEFEHYTCPNPESGIACGKEHRDHFTTAHPDELGWTGQPHTGVNHNRRLEGTPCCGQGPTLVWETYEHRAHTKLEFVFADGFELYVVLDSPTHLADVQLVSGSADAAVFTPAPRPGRATG